MSIHLYCIMPIVHFSFVLCSLAGYTRQVLSISAILLSLHTPEEGSPQTRNILSFVFESSATIVKNYSITTAKIFSPPQPAKMSNNKKSGAPMQLGQDYQQFYHHNNLQRNQTKDRRTNLGYPRRSGPQYQQGPPYRGQQNHGSTSGCRQQQQRPSNTTSYSNRTRRQNPKPKQGHPCMSPLDTKLLQLRKIYKNSSLNFINLQTQANFLSACLLHNLTPRGFRIRLRCLTPKKNRSNVEEVFKGHLKEAEDGFTTIFRDHLHFVAAQIKEEIDNTLLEIHQITNTVSISELLCHQGFQAATERNIQKEARWRAHLAQRKLSELGRAAHRLLLRNRRDESPPPPSETPGDPSLPTLLPTPVSTSRDTDRPPPPADKETPPAPPVQQQQQQQQQQQGIYNFQ